ncbi:MAG TPA: hypothetical protein VK817_24760 [Trebonia sp.]|nr:hypothetical protein [Trebonia sp.]
MRLGKKEAAGYVADNETDEIPDAAPSVPTMSELAIAIEAAAREPEKAATAG